MNAAQFSSALGKVDDKYIMEAVTYKSKKRSGWPKWGVMVACLCLIFTVAWIKLSGILNGLDSIVPSPNPNVFVPGINSEEEPAATEQQNWQTIEEICGVGNQDGSAVMALYIPTYVAYRGAFYGAVGESRVDQTGAVFFNADSTMFDAGTSEQIRFAATTENVIYNPSVRLNPTYKHTVYLVENHPDCIALLINDYFTIYQKQFDVTFEIEGITYGIVYEMMDSDHCTLGETLLSNGNFTVYEAAFYLDESNEYTVYVVDLHPELRADGYDSVLEDGVNTWWVAEPLNVEYPDESYPPTHCPDTTIVPGSDLDEPDAP